MVSKWDQYYIKCTGLIWSLSLLCYVVNRLWTASNLVLCILFNWTACCGSEMLCYTGLVLSSVLIRRAEVCLYAGQVLGTVLKPARDKVAPKCSPLFFTTSQKGRREKKLEKKGYFDRWEQRSCAVIDGVQMNISGPLLVPLMQNHQSQLVPRQAVTRGHSHPGLFLLRLCSVSRLLRQACLSQTP